VVQAALSLGLFFFFEVGKEFVHDIKITLVKERVPRR